MTVTVENCRNLRLHFGKYRGCTYHELLERDRGYLLWMLRNRIQNVQFDTRMTSAIRYGSSINTVSVTDEAWDFEPTKVVQVQKVISKTVNGQYNPEWIKSL